VPSFYESLKVDGQDMETYVSLPSGSGPHPAVVIAYTVGGVDEPDKSLPERMAIERHFHEVTADRLAAEGYAAVVPNFFHRCSPEIMAGPRMDRFKHYSDPEIITDGNAVVEFLKSHSAIDSDRIGITGFCSGGRVTWLMAAVNPIFKACVPFFGGDIMVPKGPATQSPFDLASGINCPVMFHFGGTDSNPSPEDMAKLDTELTRLGKPHQFYSYPGAGHAFMDFTSPDEYSQEASEAAWPRTLEFFATHLKGAAVPR
jgi:carboxymethylenebutenolidase